MGWKFARFSACARKESATFIEHCNNIDMSGLGNNMGVVTRARREAEQREAARVARHERLVAQADAIEAAALARERDAVGVAANPARLRRMSRRDEIRRDATIAEIRDAVGWIETSEENVIGEQKYELTMAHRDDIGLYAELLADLLDRLLRDERADILDRFIVAYQLPERSMDWISMNTSIRIRNVLVNGWIDPTLFEGILENLFQSGATELDLRDELVNIGIRIVPSRESPGGRTSKQAKLVASAAGREECAQAISSLQCVWNAPREEGECLWYCIAAGLLLADVTYRGKKFGVARQSQKPYLCNPRTHLRKRVQWLKTWSEELFLSLDPSQRPEVQQWTVEMLMARMGVQLNFVSPMTMKVMGSIGSGTKVTGDPATKLYLLEWNPLFAKHRAPLALPGGEGGVRVASALGAAMAAYDAREGDVPEAGPRHLPEGEEAGDADAMAVSELGVGEDEAEGVDGGAGAGGGFIAMEAAEEEGEEVAVEEAVEEEVEEEAGETEVEGVVGAEESVVTQYHVDLIKDWETFLKRTCPCGRVFATAILRASHGKNCEASRAVVAREGGSVYCSLCRSEVPRRLLEEHCFGEREECSTCGVQVFQGLCKRLHARVCYGGYYCRSCKTRYASGTPHECTGSFVQPLDPMKLQVDLHKVWVYDIESKSEGRNCRTDLQELTHLVVQNVGLGTRRMWYGAAASKAGLLALLGELKGTHRFIAHNGSGFDSHFVMQMLLEQTAWSVDPMENGCRLKAINVTMEEAQSPWNLCEYRDFDASTGSARRYVKSMTIRSEATEIKAWFEGDGEGVPPPSVVEWATRAGCDVRDVPADRFKVVRQSKRKRGEETVVSERVVWSDRVYFEYAYATDEDGERYRVLDRLTKPSETWRASSVQNERQAYIDWMRLAFEFGAQAKFLDSKLMIPLFGCTLAKLCRTFNVKGKDLTPECFFERRLAGTRTQVPKSWFSASQRGGHDVCAREAFDRVYERVFMEWVPLSNGRWEHRMRWIDVDEFLMSYCVQDVQALSDALRTAHCRTMRMHGVSVLKAMTGGHFSVSLWRASPEFDASAMCRNEGGLDTWLRRGLYGGRTEMFSLWFEPYVDAQHMSEWETMMFDVTSEYPWAMTLPLPYGKPEIRVYKTEAEQRARAAVIMANPWGELNGLCDMSEMGSETQLGMLEVDIGASRRKIQAPVLPSHVRAGGANKLVYDRNVRFRETHHSLELAVAVTVEERVITRVYKEVVWEARPFMRSYVQRQAATKTAIDVERKRLATKQKAGEPLSAAERDRLAALPGEREIQKVMVLNSLFGKTAERVLHKTTRVIRSRTEWQSVCHYDDLRWFAVNPECYVVSYVDASDRVYERANMNVFVGITVLRRSHLKLWSLLLKHNGCAHLMDTDSAMVSVRRGAWPLPGLDGFGSVLGEWTDDLADEPTQSSRKGVVLRMCSPALKTYWVDYVVMVKRGSRWVREAKVPSWPTSCRDESASAFRRFIRRWYTWAMQRAARRWEEEDVSAVLEPGTVLWQRYVHSKVRMKGISFASWHGRVEAGSLSFESFKAMVTDGAVEHFRGRQMMLRREPMAVKQKDASGRYVRDASGEYVYDYIPSYGVSTMMDTERRVEARVSALKRMPCVDGRTRPYQDGERPGMVWELQNVGMMAGEAWLDT